jgi:ketosteroid isomerase-like protein
MSQENVESMRRGLNAWRGGDTETIERLMDEFLAPDFEIEPLYFDGTYRGREQLWQLWSDLDEFWDEYRLEIEDLVDLGEHVLAVSRVRGRGRGSGVPVNQRMWILWRFSGQRAVHAKSFASKAEALEAAGLRE